MSLKVYECDGDSDTMTKSDYVTVTRVNNAPDKPANPAPYDGATEVSIDEAVSWTGGGDPDAEDTVTYDVYFGTDTNPPLVSENQMETVYDPDTLNPQTNYYWQIVATDINGASAESEVWSFTTAASSDFEVYQQGEDNCASEQDTISNESVAETCPDVLFEVTDGNLTVFEDSTMAADDAPADTTSDTVKDMAKW